MIADNLGKKKVVQHGKKTSSSAETLKCFVYQKTAHLAKDCPDIKKTKNETALAILDENDLESEEDDALEKISITSYLVLRLVPQQLLTFIGLLSRRR